MSVIDDLSALREQVEGTDAVEAERLSKLETTLKRAMLVKTLGEHSAMLQLRATLEHRIELVKRFLVRMAEEIPADATTQFSHNLKMKEMATRKKDYEWFLNLFTVATERVEKAEEVINNSLGKVKSKK